MALKKFLVSDGKMVLHLQPAGNGWYAVTSPIDPAITTQAKSVEEAFVMAYDAQKCLKAARAGLGKQLKSLGDAKSRKDASDPKSGRKANTGSRVRSAGVVDTKKKTHSR